MNCSCLTVLRTYILCIFFYVKTGILLATTPILPYDPRDYAVALTRIYDGLEQQYGTVLQEKNITLGEVAVVSADVGSVQ